MARAEALRLGPFVGGLNTASDPTAVADSEMVDCINFELDIDGSLVCRPPIVETTNLSASWTERIVIIGRAVFAGGNYIIGSNSDGVYSFDGTTWTLIKAGLESRVALQFNDNVWIVPVPACAVDGGRWNPTDGFVTDANMPEGESAIFHKTRMFIVPGVDATTNTSRIRFTEPITSATLDWASTNLIDISPGDGEKLIDLIVYNDNLMLFKQDSTFILAYDLAPSDAIVRAISTTIGATSRRCVATYENSVFLYHEGDVYEIVNYDFQRTNLKVPFTYDGASPDTRAEEVFLSLVGDRLLVRYYNRIYVYGLKTRTWTRWASINSDLHNFGPLVPFPSNPTQSVNTKYYGGSAIVSSEQVFYIADGYDATTTEDTLTDTYSIECSMTTKNFDLSDSHHFKKMMWWGADILTNKDIEGSATPVVSSFQATWGDLATSTWADIAANTWAQPLTEPSTQTTTVVDDTAVQRKFVKFLKTLRFRQINFSISLQSFGSTVDGPCRLFSLTAIIGSKQTVGKQVN